MDILYLIPARAGSKGLPGKNTKILKDIPLVEYSINFALQNMKESDVLCISTDDQEVLKIANERGIKTPFVRPEELCTDTATSHDVIIHALNYYKTLNRQFDAVLLLQPTSPFRKKIDFDNTIKAFDAECEMVATVKVSKESPYFTLFEEKKDGYLEKSKTGNFTNRQAAPIVYAFNGSIYLIKTSALYNTSISDFKKVKKVLMPEERSIDIDTPIDWALAEYYCNLID